MTVIRLGTAVLLFALTSLSYGAVMFNDSSSDAHATSATSTSTTVKHQQAVELNGPHATATATTSSTAVSPSTSTTSATAKAVVLNHHSIAPVATRPVRSGTPKAVAHPVVLHDGSPQLVNRIVAVVNDDVITQAQLNAAIVSMKADIIAGHQTVPNDTVLARQVLKQLIDRKLQLQLAAHYNIKASDKEIDDMVADLAKQDHMTVAALYRAAPSHGFTRESFRRQIKETIITQKLLQGAMNTQIHISDQDVDNLLHQLAHDPNIKKSYRVQDILIALPATPSPQQITQARNKTVALLQQLRQGADFNQVSAASSQAANALKGGDLGWLPLGGLPDVFEKAVVNMKVGQLAGPIRTPNGFHIIKLTGIRGLTPESALIQVEVRQIVLKPTAKRSVKSTAALANRLHTELMRRGDFGQMARRYSQDGHACKSGYVGWIDPKHYYATPALATTVLHLNPGQVSQVLVCQGNYYLIQVLAKRKAFSADKDERQKVRRLLRQRRIMEQAQTWLSRLRARSYIKIMLPELKDSNAVGTYTCRHR